MCWGTECRWIEKSVNSEHEFVSEQRICARRLLNLYTVNSNRSSTQINWFSALVNARSVSRHWNQRVNSLELIARYMYRPALSTRALRHSIINVLHSSEQWLMLTWRVDKWFIDCAYCIEVNWTRITSSAFEQQETHYDVIEEKRTKHLYSAAHYINLSSSNSARAQCTVEV